jgi:hypothetical protein
MAGTFNTDTIYLVTGRVLSVDEAAGTCSVEAVTGKATTTIDGVEFQTTISDGLLFIPKIDSEVKVLFSTYTTPFIAQYGDLDKIFIAAEQVQFNDGALEGMVKVVELTEKLNNIENDINDLKAKLQTLVTTITTAAGAAPVAPVTNATALGWFNPFLPYASGQLTPTQQADIENPLITQ